MKEREVANEHEMDAETTARTTEGETNGPSARRSRCTARGGAMTEPPVAGGRGATGLAVRASMAAGLLVTAILSVPELVIAQATEPSPLLDASPEPPASAARRTARTAPAS